MASDYFDHNADTVRVKRDKKFEGRMLPQGTDPRNSDPHAGNPLEIQPTGFFKRLTSRHAKSHEAAWVQTFNKK
jgi:hypothetical protein